MVIDNDHHTTKYSRVHGTNAGAFGSRQELAPNRLSKLSLNYCNQIANESGGTWDGGWKPKKKERLVSDHN